MKRVAGWWLVALAIAGIPFRAEAGCGCDKPPPSRAAVRPFAAHSNQMVTLFDDRLVEGAAYDVQFTASADESTDWSRGRALVRRDLADGQPRVQLRVAVGAVGLGPTRITVWRDGALLYALEDDAFTVVAAPLELHDFRETVSRRAYRAAVGRDGTMYIALDVHGVDGATTFTGRGVGLPLAFEADGITIYNAQGFLMQVLDPARTDLFRIARAGTTRSAGLTYWRHEFGSYKAAHRQLDRYGIGDDAAGEWHADGTYHVDHDHLLVAIRGHLPDGTAPAPGATAEFRLIVTSTPRPSL